MTRNSSGSYRTTRENVYKAFDKLPLEVREALRNAISDYVPQPLATMLKRGSSPERVAAQVERWNRMTLAKREEQRAAARGPYEGLAPEPNRTPATRRVR